MATKPPPSWMVRLNVAMLRRGLRIGSQHLLSVRGRRTGLVRTTPVSIATVGDDRFIVAGSLTRPGSAMFGRSAKETSAVAAQVSA